jgi:hypothetical protein
MLQDLRHLHGAKLGAKDGEIGHVKDFYFDDQSWSVRYVVADTGSWLSGRQVLLSPHAFATHAFQATDEPVPLLQVNLSRKRIEESPSIDEHRPVSRQHESEYYRYYGLPVYWADGGMGMFDAVPLPILSVDTAELALKPKHAEDPHLRSTDAVTGYHVHAIDGEVGRVAGFMVSGDWVIRELMIESGHWYSSKPLLIRTSNVTRISYQDSTLFVNLSLEDLRLAAGDSTPAVQPSL